MPDKPVSSIITSKSVGEVLENIADAFARQEEWVRADQTSRLVEGLRDLVEASALYVADVDENGSVCRVREVDEATLARMAERGSST